MKCLNCKKELEIKEGQERLNPKRLFCNGICNSRYNAKKEYYKQRDNPKYKEKRRNYIKNVWYPNNKEKQKESILKNYYKNKEKWNERKFSDRHRKNIMKFINPLCSCGKETRIIKHKSFGDYPKLKGSPNKELKEENIRLLEEYTRRNLIGVCSKLCLEKERR